MTELFSRDKTIRAGARHAAPKPPSKLSRGAFQTLPILLAGSMAMTFGATAPLDAPTLKPDKKNADEAVRVAVKEAMRLHAASKPTQSEAVGFTAGTVPASVTPSTYRVVSGDTVSGIATRYGLATASVLALNGLGWNSLIFPGQILKLSNTTPAPIVDPSPAGPVAAPPVNHTAMEYTIARGDTISAIAHRYGVTTQSVLDANQLGWSTIIYPGQRIRIPQITAPTPPVGDPAPSAPPAGTDSHQNEPPVVPITPVVDVTPITPAPAPQNVTYRIVSGDTVTSIAAHFGVSVQSILDANGITRSSIIYAGRTLVIPGTSTAPAGVSGAVTPLTDEMAANARTIISVGASLGVSDFGLVIALAAAMQESSLRNLNYGDRDSLGLFQQRPSTGWGTPAQVMDTTYASRLFFGGPSNPNRGNTNGLLDISGWQSMTVTQAAQAVQRSAYPDAYAKWETSARAWLAQLR